MRAEIILDLFDVGADVGRALGRDAAVFPALGNVERLWNQLGIEVASIHVVAPGPTSPTEKDAQTFGELHTIAWWKTESVFVGDAAFDAALELSASDQHGPIGLAELMTTLALSRSDALAAHEEQSLVIIMSNSPLVAPAVSHARGVPVMIAGTTVSDSGLSHARLDLSWMGLLKERSSAFTLDDVALRNGRPWIGEVAVCTPFDRTDGRDLQAGELPTFAESIALLDPHYFEMVEHPGWPDSAAIATVMHTLGLGALVHVEDLSARRYHNAKAESAATLYRFAADNPDAPIVVASTRPSMVAITSALDTYRIVNPDRVLRFCVPERDGAFDESAFATSNAACRIMIDDAIVELRHTSETPPDDSTNVKLTVINGGGVDATHSPTAPTLVVHENPNTIRDDSQRWREASKRRFLLLGADGDEAVPAHDSQGTFLPISLFECTDFDVRPPELRPGCIVEGLLHPEGDRWIVVSDPIERRRSARQAKPETSARAAA